MPNPTLGHYRDRAKEKQDQLELFQTFQKLDIFALSRLLVAAKLPHFSTWLKQATILTVADTIPSDVPNYYQTVADKASQILDQKITLSAAKATVYEHAGCFSAQKNNQQLQKETSFS